MDVSTITDKDKLQSMAYEQIKFLNQAQSNLGLIEQRLVQLEEIKKLEANGKSE